MGYVAMSPNVAHHRSCATPAPHQDGCRWQIRIEGRSGGEGWGGRAIAKLQPTTQLNLNGSLRTTAEDHQAIKLLVTNANAREQAANLVARIPAIPSQRAAKAEWVSGIREGVRLDVETADAVFTILSGDPTAGRRELDSKALANIQFQSNKLVAQADGALGVK